MCSITWVVDIEREQVGSPSSVSARLTTTDMHPLLRISGWDVSGVTVAGLQETVTTCSRNCLGSTQLTSMGDHHPLAECL